MRVGLFLPNLIYDDNGHLTTDASTHHKLPLLAEAFDSLDVSAFVCRTHEVRGREPFALTPRLRLEPLPAIRSGWELYGSRLAAWMWTVWRCVRRHRRMWSAALVIDSGPASHWFFECCRRAGIPTAIYVRGNALASVGCVDRYRSGIRQLARTALERWYPWSLARMARTSPVVLDNDLLAEQLKSQGADVRLIVASLIRPANVLTRPPQPSVPPEPLRLCWVGRMVRLKGLHVLLEALAMLAKTGIRFQLELIGPGDESYVRELQARAAQPDLCGRVRFVGPIAHGDALFASLDRAEVFVLPSFTEGTPKTVTEAAARGLVVVASRVGGLPRLVANGQSGFLVPARDPKLLFERLRTLALDPLLRYHMAENTLNLASRLTLDKQLPTLVAALQDAARPACACARGARTFAQ